ncbi:MAG: hypothetical protein CCU26_12405 [Nitrospira sp. UW-LDO-01]|nr:MAG: hypothetical protein CCU26_12405 [Nitrospira sp. UW-LDO-01]
MDHVSIAAGVTFIDNKDMRNDQPKSRYHTLMRHIEHRIIAVGMSVIAYLLEKAILRSLKNGSAKP